MARKPTAKKPALAQAVETSGPDFSKLKCERPLSDPAALQRAKDDADAFATYQRTLRMTDSA